MAKLFDRVKFNISGTPGTGTVTIGTRYDNSFYLPTEQGAVDGDEVYYVIQKSNKDEETGIGTIATGQTTITRDTVLSSIVAGTKGTTKINIDGSAFMALVTPAYALKSLRSVRTVTGATDTIADGDGAGQITYNSASAVAASLAQAGASLAFLKGWYCFVRNTNAGAVTITPTTSTINGVSTLVLAQGDAALIVSDSANYTAIVSRGAVVIPNYLTGLTLSTAGSSATFGIAVGRAADTTNVAMMALASAYTKTTSAWAVGTANGALDIGTIANSTWYHVWLIQRSDTGVVDVLISLSATAPNMPTNYDRKRRIGAMKTNGSAQWTTFLQLGNRFLWNSNVNDLNNGTVNTSLSVTLTVPTGIVVAALLSVYGTSTTTYPVYVSTPSLTGGFAFIVPSASAYGGGSIEVNSNTSAQVTISAPGTISNVNVFTWGWVDTRGQ